MKQGYAEFDLLLSYNRLDSALVEPLNDALRTRGLRVLKDNWYLRPGEPWPTTLENDLASSRAVVIAIGRSGLGPWQQREVVAALNRQSRSLGTDDAVPVILVLLEQRSQAQVGLSFLLQDCWIEGWRPKAPDLIAKIVRGELPANDPGHALPDPRTQVCPYRGLGVFREEDSGFYFGRESDLARLTAAVDRHPVVAIVGTSGSGKSSLARAGLAPCLRRNGGARVWQIAQMTPGINPFSALARALVPLCEPERVLTWSQGHLANECDRLESRLDQDGGEHLSRAIRQILAQEPGTTHLMLLVDQWEEVYTNLPTGGESTGAHSLRLRRFIEMLLEAVTKNPLQVAFTLRADNWGKVLNDASLAESLPDDAIVHLRALDRSALERIIRTPAEMTGLTLPDALTEALLDDAAGRRDQLPLLAFTLQRLWSRRAGLSGELTLDAYRDIGGLEEPIAACTEAVYADLIPQQQDALPPLFSALVEVSDKGAEPRVGASLEELDGNAQAAARQFEKERLLVMCRDWSSGKELVSFAHEVLLYHWPRLQGWIGRRRAAVANIRQLQTDAHAWRVSGRATACRWSLERVREAAVALKLLGPEVSLSSEEQEFLGPVDPDAIEARIARPKATHRERALLGKRLAILGDRRTGTGVGPSGTPEIAWCPVYGGEVAIRTRRRLLSGTRRRRKRVDSFNVGRYPVTVAQYRAFLEAEDGWRDLRWWRDDLYRDPEGDKHETGHFANHPAVRVNWFDVVAFCRWLSHRLDMAVRLPGEWEWQQAATYGEHQNRFPWGPDWNPGREPFRANTRESRLAEATAVGMYPAGASSRGRALDMAGTVWEWCRDRYDKPGLVEAYADRFEQRSVRGGSWDSDRADAQVTARCGRDPRCRSSTIGFRVVCLSPLLSD